MTTHTDNLNTWLTDRFHTQLHDDPKLTARLLQALKLGLPKVVVTATPVPLAGSPERARWEDACDECGIKMGERRAHAHVGLLNPLTGLIVVMTASFCLVCVETFNDDRINVERSSLPNSHDYLSAMQAELGSERFAVVIGESFEAAEHQASL